MKQHHGVLPLLTFPSERSPRGKKIASIVSPQNKGDWELISGLSLYFSEIAQKLADQRLFLGQRLLLGLHVSSRWQYFLSSAHVEFLKICLKVCRICFCFLVLLFVSKLQVTINTLIKMMFLLLSC